VKRSGALGIWGSTSESDLGLCPNLPVFRLPSASWEAGSLGPASCDAKRRRVTALVLEIRRTGEGRREGNK
jgi:hypothetical protein